MREKILTYHEIFDRNAEQIRSVCKESLCGLIRTNGGQISYLLIQ